MSILRSSKLTVWLKLPRYALVRTSPVVNVESVTSIVHPGSALSFHALIRARCLGPCPPPQPRSRRVGSGPCCCRWWRRVVPDHQEGEVEVPLTRNERHIPWSARRCIGTHRRSCTAADGVLSVLTRPAGLEVGKVESEVA